jgi:TRAP transporter TAXI family solute receptor
LRLAGGGNPSFDQLPEPGLDFPMLPPDRRHFLAVAGASIAGCAFWPGPLLAAGPTLAFMTAGQGSAFLPYGQGVAVAVNAAGVATLEVRESKGSIENLSAVEASATTIGTAFLGSAYEALNGIGPFAAKPHGNLRALVPMYETAFHVAAKTSSGIATIRALDGKRVGVGPAPGPAEAFFRAWQRSSVSSRYLPTAPRLN